MPTIKVHLNTRSIDSAIRYLEEYHRRVENAGDEIAKRLADLGYQVAYGVMSGHIFSGETIESLEVERVEEGQYVLRAGSKAILFFEFGAGIRYGGGHPWSDDLGYGSGTYPGNGHWDDPDGWWFPTDDPRLIYRIDKNGQGWGHSYGNKPHMPFYLADKEIRDNIIKIAKDVIKG